MEITTDNLKNIALLIDADNTSPAAIDPVLTVMAELGQVNIRPGHAESLNQAQVLIAGFFLAPFPFQHLCIGFALLVTGWIDGE